MQIYTLQNTTRRMLVYQLDRKVASGDFKNRSEDVTRIDHDRSGNVTARKIRLRHPPVLRILAGQTVEVPASVMHDRQIKRALAVQGRPPLKVVRKETEEEWRARKNAVSAAQSAAADAQAQATTPAAAPKGISQGRKPPKPEPTSTGSE